ncbi:alpha/beta fold hydrolase [Nocardioides marmotae]|uniref:Alpha/beta fold hydrolase n=1 Tax=Nocardioides marmotae TaxID=2663857 RepID=A0A6I3J4A1_9ACTN|nr:alpha/beta fold hydrolase [Nocardioides marmotae]MCR6030290.1 alpha/beta fold hydrolase [Gordonia jinghuaiqii]MBC9734419.1 alpha/beta fold hydrolase [Nocardioides marmotae]MTB85519.1 alpha/beta fold hydrolase [Nocardioides marmotae]MTB93922.1 alpha/beta fold hydrolase [Nocardioides marmotae]QKE00240.1 alpha/beta fold hydrolase [Nocardioides marmotae]
MSARLERFHHDGLTFDVHDSGPEDGDPVVLLHGFPERATSWRHVEPLLHAAGLRTYAMDQRGYSPGARPEGRSSYKVELLVGDVEALVRIIGRPVHLVGHDWGANVAWALTGQHPELIRTLTAVSVPHPAAFTAAMTSSDQALRSWYMLLFQLPRVAELSAQVGGGRVFERFLRNAGMDEEDVARVHREVVEDGALPHALGWYRGLPLSDRSVMGHSIQVPTTMVWSDGDVALARKGVELTERYCRSDYELVVLEGVSHWIPTHAPEALAEAILERVAGT